MVNSGMKNYGDFKPFKGAAIKPTNFIIKQI
jgi:hypothetical protein